MEELTKEPDDDALDPELGQRYEWLAKARMPDNAGGTTESSIVVLFIAPLPGCSGQEEPCINIAKVTAVKI